VRDWLSGRSAPSGARADWLVELGAIVDRLARDMRADLILIWLTRPIQALDHESPSRSMSAATIAVSPSSSASWNTPPSPDQIDVDTVAVDSERPRGAGLGGSCSRCSSFEAE
jgi:hypothetical protein